MSDIRELIARLRGRLEQWQANAGKVERASTAQYANAVRAAKASRQKLEFEACLALPQLLDALEASPAPLREPGEVMVERVARAIEDAGVGHSIRLTSLVDGVSEYTATVSGQEPRTFESYEDAGEYVDKWRFDDKARAAIAALSKAD